MSLSCDPGESTAYPRHTPSRLALSFDFRFPYLVHLPLSSRLVNVFSSLAFSRLAFASTRSCLVSLLSRLPCCIVSCLSCLVSCCWSPAILVARSLGLLDFGLSILWSLWSFGMWSPGLLMSWPLGHSAWSLCTLVSWSLGLSVPWPLGLLDYWSLGVWVSGLSPHWVSWSRRLFVFGRLASWSLVSFSLGLLVSLYLGPLGLSVSRSLGHLVSRFSDLLVSWPLGLLVSGLLAPFDPLVSLSLVFWPLGLLVPGLVVSFSLRFLVSLHLCPLRLSVSWSLGLSVLWPLGLLVSWSLDSWPRFDLSVSLSLVFWSLGLWSLGLMVS